MKKNYFFFLLIFILLNTKNIWPHGVGVNILRNSIGLQAIYEDGVPISKAQFTFYKINNDNPFLVLTANDIGQVFFFPKKDEKLYVKYNDSLGHGGEINLSISKGELVISTQKDSMFPRVIVIIAVVWGFIGTALFFLKKRKS